MLATQVQIRVPKPIKAVEARAIMASALDGKVSPAFFKPERDAYPEVIVASTPFRQEQGVITITALQGPQLDELMTNLPALISAFQERFRFPCEFQVQNIFPRIRQGETVKKYEAIYVGLSRNLRAPDCIISGEKAAELLERAVRTGIERFARRSGMDILHFDFATDLANQETVNLMPVTWEREGQGKFSYLTIPRASFVTNLDIHHVHVGAMATHGHGRVVHVF